MPDTARVTTAELAAALIAVFEGDRLTAYQDSGGVWTIGLGHTAGVHAGMVITEEQSLAFLEQDCAPLLAMVANQPVLAGAALVSFGYNCGRYTMESVIGGHDTIGDPRHTTDRHGTVLPGLVARRRLEETLLALAAEVPAAVIR